MEEFMLAELKINEKYEMDFKISMLLLQKKIKRHITCLKEFDILIFF